MLCVVVYFTDYNDKSSIYLSVRICLNTESKTNALKPHTHSILIADIAFFIRVRTLLITEQ